MDDEQKAAAKERVEAIGRAKAEKQAAQLEADKAVRDQSPVQMSLFAEELAAQLQARGDDVIIFDEALTSSPALVRYLPPERTGKYFLTRGGSLGVGIPGAIGAKLANPNSTVIGLTGDGGSMYTIQALWTAARHNVDAKFVICNNSSYRLLQLNVEQYWSELDVPKHDYPLSFDLSRPPLHFVDMARGMGVQGVRVEKPWEVEAAIEQMLAHPGPFLIDLVLDSDTHPERVGNTCGQ
jgi:benzoylformate decarboxylase